MPDTDWPTRTMRRNRGLGFAEWAFEDLLAPDAFGVHLLGPGYAGRLELSDAWDIRTVAHATSLVAHKDADVWFAAPSRHWSPGRPDPPVLPLPRPRVCSTCFGAFEASHQLELAVLLDEPPEKGDEHTEN